MSTHFIDRINIRAGDQDETFLNLAKSVHFIMARREEFQSLRIGIQIDAHFFFLRLDDNNKFACLTYYYNPTRTTFPEGADKKFKLTSERSNDEV